MRRRGWRLRSSIGQTFCRACAGLNASESGADDPRASSRLRARCGSAVRTPAGGRHCQPWLRRDSSPGSSDTVPGRGSSELIPQRPSTPRTAGTLVEWQSQLFPHAMAHHSQALAAWLLSSPASGGAMTSTATVTPSSDSSSLSSAMSASSGRASPSCQAASHSTWLSWP